MTNSTMAQKYNKKAKLELKKGNVHGAVQNFRRAYEANPKDQRFLARYASAVLKLGNAQEALRAGSTVLNIEPENLDALIVSSEAAKALRDWAVMLHVCTRWSAAYPNDIEATRSLVFAHFELGELEKARDVYGKLVESNPRSAEFQEMYARLCLGAFDYSGAENALEKAHKLAPSTAESLYALARVKMFLGALEEAETLCEEAIKRNPNFALAFVQYVTLRNGNVDDGVAAKISMLLTGGAMPPEHKASLYFAQGDIHHKREKYTDAMLAYDRGNEVSGGLFAREGQSYNPKFFEYQRECERKLFLDMPSEQKFAPGPAIPVFVVGMPRSGTTLIESILAAHEDVFGAGELGELPVIHNSALHWSESNGNASLAKVPVSQLQSWRDQYFNDYPNIEGAKYVVDKQPMNFRSVGLIKTLFPEAVIIHTRRNPVDTGFSIYKNDFGKAWPYATQLANIAHFYGEYAQLARNWEEQFGDGFPLFQYEELVADFEPHVRRLLKLCDLEWRDECLDFHKAKRAVATFSTTQVRQPIRKTATSAQAQYGDLLNPLVEGLTLAGVDIKTGALIS